MYYLPTKREDKSIKRCGRPDERVFGVISVRIFLDLYLFGLMIIKSGEASMQCITPIIILKKILWIR